MSYNAVPPPGGSAKPKFDMAAMKAKIQAVREMMQSGPLLSSILLFFFFFLFIKPHAWTTCTKLTSSHKRALFGVLKEADFLTPPLQMDFLSNFPSSFFD